MATLTPSAWSILVVGKKTAIDSADGADAPLHQQEILPALHLGDDVIRVARQQKWHTRELLALFSQPSVVCQYQCIRFEARRRAMTFATW